MRACAPYGSAREIYKALDCTKRILARFDWLEFKIALSSVLTIIKTSKLNLIARVHKSISIRARLAQALRRITL